MRQKNCIYLGTHLSSLTCLILDPGYWILDTIDCVTHGILMLLLVLGHLTLYWVHLHF